MTNARLLLLMAMTFFVSLVTPLTVNAASGDWDDILLDWVKGDKQTSDSLSKETPDPATVTPSATVPEQKSGFRKQLESLSVNFDISALNRDFGGKSNFQLKAKTGWRPSYLQNQYTRTESFVPQLSIDLSHYLKIKLFPVSISPVFESDFYRQFYSENDVEDYLGLRSKTNRPYTLEQVPTDSATALNKLQVGDIYNYRNQLVLTVALATYSKLFNLSPVSADIKTMFSGQFILNIARLPLDHVRLKIIAIKQHGPIIEGAAEYIPFIPTPHGILLKAVRLIFKLVTDRISPRIALTQQGFGRLANLPEMHYSYFVTDYFIDLRDAKAAAAYNRLVGPYFLFEDHKIKGMALAKVAEIVNPLIQNLEKTQKLITVDLQGTEELPGLDLLYKQDVYAGIAPSSRRVHRYIQVSQSSDQDVFIKHEGMDLLMYNEDRNTFSRDGLNSFNNNGHSRHFDHYVYEESHEEKRNFGLKKRAEIKTLDALCLTDNIENNCHMELGVHYELTSTNFNVNQQLVIFNYLKANLPANIYNSVDWGDWAKLYDRRNAYANTLILFKPDFARKISPDSVRDMRYIFEYYLKQKGMDIYATDFGRDVRDRDLQPSPQLQGVADKNREELARERTAELDEIVANLSVVLDFTRPDRDRINHLFNLKKNPLFQEFGPGMILSLMTPSDAAEAVYLTVKLTAKDSKDLIWPPPKNPCTMTAKEKSDQDALREGLAIYNTFTAMQSQIYRAIDPQIQNEQLRLIFEGGANPGEDACNASTKENAGTTSATHETN